MHPPRDTTTTTRALWSTTALLVLLQIGSRAFSFGLNQLLLRSTTPHAFGVATIQFDTVRDTVLFASREGIRGAIVRNRGTERTSNRTTSGDDDGDVERQTRLIPVLLSPLVPLAFYLFHMFVVSRSSSSSSDKGGGGYTATLGLYAVSTVVELVAEPAYLLTLSRWETLTSTRVRVEGFAVAAKAIATLAALNLFDQRPTLEAYGWGQVAYAVTVLVGLESSLRRRRRHSSSRSLSVWAKIRKLSTKDDDRYFDRDVTRFAWALTKQGLVKQVLTEGDKLAVAKFGRAEDLGAYAVALNYGSLVARIVFQPLEESSRLYFSSQAATTEATTRRQRSSIARHLSRVLEFYSHLTLVLTLLVPPYVAPVLSVLLGPQWSRTTARVLVWYVYSLPFLAVNGILEACVASVADERTLKWTSWWFALCTVAFASTVYVTMSSSSSSSSGSGWGSRGIILGNCVNMSMRIAFSSVFLSRYLTNTTDEVKEDQDKGDERTIEGKKEEDDALLHPTRWLPSVSTVVAFLIANQVCRQSEQTWTTTGRSDLRSLAVHVAIGAVVGTGCLGVIAISKRSELRTLMASSRRWQEEKSKED